MVVTRGSIRGWIGGVVAGLTLMALMLHVVIGQALAAPLAVEPRDILLTTDDLPPGFKVDPRYTREGPIENAGPAAQVQYSREATPENLNNGPLVVGQLIVRLESGMGAGDALALVRQRLIDTSNFAPSDVGPNDGGTFTLHRIEGSIELYAIGFIKENMVIVTTTGGLPGTVAPDGTLALAGISSARLDSMLGR
jgi:hypothetical protein